jgi:hypothetical protein
VLVKRFMDQRRNEGNEKRMLDYVYIVSHGLLLCVFLSLLTYIYRLLMYSLRVIQYITFLSTWYQSTGSESPLIFFIFFRPLPNNFLAPPLLPPYLIALSSSVLFPPSPCFELMHIPIETWGDNVPEPSRTAQSELHTLPRTA